MAFNEPIALIGSANRFPGGLDSPSKLWEFLKKPTADLQSKVPKERFDIDAFYHPDGSVRGCTNTRYGYFLRENLNEFDASFFNIQAGEAEGMDPQQRLLLETTFEAVASAGLRVEDLRGSRTAVFVGLMTHDFELNHSLDYLYSPTYLATGSAISITSNRISYFFDWHGPSVTIDTACSSSLVALQLAVQQLRCGESKVAVAAGANLLLSPLGFIAESKLNMLSPTGRSRMWDVAADGYARGEGVAALVLKTLSQALQDGDNIECIIRETGVNQDGRTTGITMPSHQAQAALIRETYAKAGLDLSKAQDRPQFFEAHGTGTPAGDPQEAQAISQAFFAEKEEMRGNQEETPPLFVGSIKTVIGHTESTAGIAGILKASLAVQHGVIPPNFLLEKSDFKLNPQVVPFYQHLSIPLEPRQWPEVAPGHPRRVSVNSFGFGGTNAHAIVEQYDPVTHNRLAGVKTVNGTTGAAVNGTAVNGTAVNGTAVNGATSGSVLCPLPLVVSARTEHSMRDSIQLLLDLVKTSISESECDWNMVDLAWTLLRRRSMMPVRRAIVVPGGLMMPQSHQDRAAAYNAMYSALKDGDGAFHVSVQQDRGSDNVINNEPRLLGIFTGQGAQWPGMMKTLISNMPFVRTIVEELDHSLQTLPPKYRPTPPWTLQECFALEPDNPLLEARLGLASFSMPLCTAVQIVLIRLLAAARVKFAAIVGHSGGETACALAAGLISPSQAIRIAYLRGLVASRHARGGGMMMAAHITYEDGQELCKLRDLQGRVCVGAVNAPVGITLSGDGEAIRHVKEILEDEDKWCRVLRVEKAYHSPHVVPCAVPYMDALRDSGCGLADDLDQSCRIASAWYSSAYEDNKLMSKCDVTAEYWAHNFVSPVLFMQAVEKALEERGPYGAAVEVGCHPALKSPTLATMAKVAADHKQKTSSKSPLPYTGCMRRDSSDVDAFAACMGLLWEHFGAAGFDANSFIVTATGAAVPGLGPGPGPGPGKVAIKNLASILPRHAWEHSREYRSDSRSKHAILRPGFPPHLLLGKRMPTSSNSVLQWRNVVRPIDHPWLEGHVLQGQTVFPAAGYITMAMEAAIEAFGNNGNGSIQLIEVLDLNIGKAVSFAEETSLAELIFTAKVVSEPEFLGSQATAILSFTIDSCLPRESKLSTSAAGRLVVTIGGDLANVLPPAQEEHPHMHDISITSFYRELQDLDYTYSGLYKGIHTIRRGDGKASGTISYPVLEDGTRRHRLVLHPASMDLALQAVFATYSSPGDQRLRCMYIPVSIDRVALVPSVCLDAFDRTDRVDINAVITYDKGDYLSASTQVSWEKDVLYEVEGLILKPLTSPSASDDHLPFTKTIWGPLSPDVELDNPSWRATEAEREAMAAIERAVYWFVRDFLQNQLTDVDRRHVAPHHQQYIKWCEHVLAEAQAGANPWHDASWEADTATKVQQLCTRYSYHPHMRMVQRVHANMWSSICKPGTSNPFEFLDQDGLLTEFYSSTTAFGPHLLYLQQAVSEIAHRYQCMDIFEVGAGTGGATRCILRTPQLGFNSYTFTDISPSFFEAAHRDFGQHDDRIDFRVFDLRQPPEQQGFTTHSYDLVIAHNVLHATPRLEETLANVRSLLKPGGYIVILEGTLKGVNRNTFIFGLFQDWWAGYDEGRIWEPFVTIEEWDTVLKRTGFTGIETRTGDRDSLVFPSSVFTSRALGIEHLYKPLSEPLKAEGNVSSYPPLVIIGGESPNTSWIMEGLQAALPHRKLRSVRRLTDLLDPDTTWIEDLSTFVILAELDEELFSTFSRERFESVKKLCSMAGRILWLTENAWLDHPLQAMTIGMIRTLRLEYEDVPMQILDLDDVAMHKLPVVRFVHEQLLRLEEISGSAALAAVENMTWTLEPEIYWSGERAWVPRIKKDTMRNNRVNSERRAIMTTASPAKMPVSLRGQSLYLEPIGSGVDMDIDAGLVVINVHYSLNKAIRVGALGLFHLVQGAVAGTGQEVVALSTTNASIVHVPARRVFYVSNASPLSDKVDPEGRAKCKCLLLPVSASLVAHAILSGTTSSCVAQGASILTLDLPGFCQKALANAAKGSCVRLYFASTTTTVQGQVPGQVLGEDDQVPLLQLHRHETEAALKRKLPENLAAVFDFSATTDARKATGVRRRLSSCLPPGCIVWPAEHLVQTDAVAMAPSCIDPDHEMAQLKLVKQVVMAAAGAATSNPPVHHDHVAADRIPTAQNIGDDLVVVDWRASEELTARIRPIDAGNLFASDKTFLLAGLGGSLGRSLARWMISRGARHVVLSSRRPELLDAAWVDDLKRSFGDNVNITTLSMDVTIEAAVNEGLCMLRRTMPPIGGIALGTMILHDTSFKDMEPEEWQSVVKVKAEGARILHEGFLDPKNNLDFFVMFSSAVKVTGNPGQANYTAGNAYLQALTQYRRVRGLTGSTIDLGALFGAGYLAKSRREEEYLSFRSRADSLAVHELHALFAEAVVSGRPGNNSTSRSLADTSEIEITAGIPDFDHTKKGFRVKYFHDPRFGNLKKPQTREERQGGEQTSFQANKVPINEQLQEATTMNQVQQVIVDGLSNKLRGTLQLSAEEVANFNPNIPLVEQGVDSLVATTITKWFSSELSLTIPVLKIISGASVSDLAEEAARRLPQSVIPLVESGSDAHAAMTESSSENENKNPAVDDQQGAYRKEEQEQDENGRHDNVNLRHERLSIAQEESWKLQQAYGKEDVSITTVGMFMRGPIDLERLARAWESSLRRHEIFRTAFPIESSHPHALPVQAIMRYPVSNMVRLVPVADREAADQELKKLTGGSRDTHYDVAAGKTMLVEIYHWPGNHGDAPEFLVVLGYHRLVGDGSTTENLFNEVGMLYNSGKVLTPTPQYSSLAARQRADLACGHLEASVQYWHDLYSKPSPPPRLPILPLPQADADADADATLWQQHEATAHVPPRVAFRIRDRSRQYKAAAMHFYLTTYHVLLTRLTRSTTAGDIAIGIEDTGRSTADQLAAMGPFANTLPVRMPAHTAGSIFIQTLSATRDRMRQAMPHAKVPLSALNNKNNTINFQAVFDYRQGATESGQIGGASIVETTMRRPPPGPGRHVFLEVSDDPTTAASSGPRINVKLPAELYGAADPGVFVDAYLALLTLFSSNPALRVEEGDLKV